MPISALPFAALERVFINELYERNYHVIVIVLIFFLCFQMSLSSMLNYQKSFTFIL